MTRQVHPHSSLFNTYCYMGIVLKTGPLFSPQHREEPQENAYKISDTKQQLHKYVLHWKRNIRTCFEWPDYVNSGCFQKSWGGGLEEKARKKEEIRTAAHDSMEDVNYKQAGESECDIPSPGMPFPKKTWEMSSCHACLASLPRCALPTPTSQVLSPLRSFLPLQSPTFLQGLNQGW